MKGGFAGWLPGAAVWLLSSTEIISATNAGRLRVRAVADRAAYAKNRERCRFVVRLDARAFCRSLGKASGARRILHFGPSPRTEPVKGGPSGSGKSTLVRVLAGLWPFATGHIHLPAGARTLFLPQRPYMPIGTLGEA